MSEDCFSSPVRSMCHTCGIVRHLSMSYVVCRLCLTKLPEIINKSTFGANVYHVPGLCLLGIGCTLYINHLKIMAQKPYFHIFDIFFSETASRMTLHIMPEDSLNLGHHNLLKLKCNSTYRHSGRSLEMEKCIDLISVYETVKNPLLQNYLTKSLDIAHK